MVGWRDKLGVTTRTKETTGRVSSHEMKTQTLMVMVDKKGFHD